jgi:hypothetical protein
MLRQDTIGFQRRRRGVESEKICKVEKEEKNNNSKHHTHQ